MTSSVELRPARPDDAAGIVAAIQSGFEPRLLEAFIYGCHGIEQYVRHLIEASAFGGDTDYTVAQVDGELAGCIELRLLPKALFLNYVALFPAFRS